ncbi:MAG TPA: PilZ domain-containing protein [Pyrinomonadaceae bacterium]|nr:PilZ domain-containing protein [Pyrinomonadaceae bacterium]
MTIERRQSPRLDVNLPARWEGVLTQESATITSLSKTGCFVLTGGKVEPRELIRLEIDLPDSGPVYFWSEVVDEAYEIGFAARFTMGDDDDSKRLDDFIDAELSRAST